MVVTWQPSVCSNRAVEFWAALCFSHCHQWQMFIFSPSLRQSVSVVMHVDASSWNCKNVDSLWGYNLWDRYAIPALWEKMSEMTEDLYENHLMITRQTRNSLALTVIIFLICFSLYCVVLYRTCLLHAFKVFNRHFVCGWLFVGGENIQLKVKVNNGASIKVRDSSCLRKYDQECSKCMTYMHFGYYNGNIRMAQMVISL